MVCFEKFPTVNFCCYCIGLEAGCFALGLGKLIVAWTVVVACTNALLKDRFIEKSFKAGNISLKTIDLHINFPR